MPILQTARTQIDPISAAEAAFFFELANSPGWLRFIGDRNIRDIASAEEYLTQKLVGFQQQHGYGYYVVRNEQGLPIGICGFLKRPFLDNVDFGFAFLPAHHRRGYGFEAGRAVLKYGLDRFGLRRVDAVTVATNVASVGLLTKLNFARVGAIEVPDGTEPVELYRHSRPADARSDEH